MSINVSTIVYTVSWGLSFVPLLKKEFWIEGKWSYMNKLRVSSELIQWENRNELKSIILKFWLIVIHAKAYFKWQSNSEAIGIPESRL